MPSRFSRKRSATAMSLVGIGLSFLIPRIGPQNSSGAQYSHFWNLQDKHATFSGPAGAHVTVLVNDAAPKEYENIEKYTTPGGLNQIMR